MHDGHDKKRTFGAVATDSYDGRLDDWLAVQGGIGLQREREDISICMTVDRETQQGHPEH